MASRSFLATKEKVKPPERTPLSPKKKYMVTSHVGGKGGSIGEKGGLAGKYRREGQYGVAQSLRGREWIGGRLRDSL